jgi:HNH endonuclease
VLARASGMSHREIRELVAELAPQPDVATSIRKLPERSATLKSESVLPPANESLLELGAPRVEPELVKLDCGVAAPARSAVPARPSVVPARPIVVEPLAPARYQVRFTASAALRDKLERLQALMRASVPDGDLARIIEIAVSEKLERVEAKRFGRTQAPRSRPPDADPQTPPSSRHIPAAVRRLVHERDGGRCAYRDRCGRRCDKRHDLEFHHKRPFAKGGDHSPANLTLMCKTHNALLAEQDYGEDLMARFRAGAGRASLPVDAYGARIVVRSRGLSPG